MSFRSIVFSLLAAAVVSAGGAAFAQSRKAAQPARQTKDTVAGVDKDAINANAVTVVSGNPNGTYIHLAFDMAAVLDDGDKLRVLPVGGKGGFQNVKDLMYLKGIDVGITQSNILSYLKRTGEFGPNIEKRLTYIAKLYNEELHILAGEGINELSDLNGKTVNLSDVGSGTQFSSRLIFEALGIKVEEVNMGQADGFEALKNKKIAATVLIAGKPAGSFGRFKLEPGMKLLAVPYVPALEADYYPATLTHEDYPSLVEKGKSIETISVGAVLTTFNWAPNTDRHNRVAKLTEALFAKFDDFAKRPRHVKWREVNLAAELPGWTRFPAAKSILDARRAAVAAAAPGGKKQFEQFFAEQKKSGAPTPTTAESAAAEQFYAKFLEWLKTKDATAAAVNAAAPSRKQ
jgi:TRAP transporter TAXI family solute receptor